jgi:hypothetical protein
MLVNFLAVGITTSVLDLFLGLPVTAQQRRKIDPPGNAPLATVVHYTPRLSPNRCSASRLLNMLQLMPHTS